MMHRHVIEHYPEVFEEGGGRTTCHHCFEAREHHVDAAGVNFYLCRNTRCDYYDYYITLPKLDNDRATDDLDFQPLAPEFTYMEIEAELQQARWTIQFLHGCLTNPAYKYSYPQHTEDFLERLTKLLPPLHPCIHSRTKADCVGCQEGVLGRSLHESVKAKLGEMSGPYPEGTTPV